MMDPSTAFVFFLFPISVLALAWLAVKAHEHQLAKQLPTDASEAALSMKAAESFTVDVRYGFPQDVDPDLVRRLQEAIGEAAKPNQATEGHGALGRS
jgi:hypothetical protein